ncbi:MAG: autotransporter-associated beta strand repeat-containing protein, partial [Verrucomicrobia bacterium]|nr:autotransporter-associated beta strand repeat-containing protein [Verrucomicrobiota bacterium]
MKTAFGLRPRMCCGVLLRLVAALAGGLMPSAGIAASVYWDSNGSVAGAGAAPAGTWGTSVFWSSSSAGTAATTAWANGSTAVFSAGTDATNVYTVTLNGSVTIAGLTVEEGLPTITGGTALVITNAATVFSLGANSAAVINSPITGAGGLAKSGASTTLTLGGANTFTGNVTINSGSGNTLEVSSDANLGGGTNITINQNATLLATASFATAKRVTFTGATTVLNVGEAATLTLNGPVGGSGTTPKKSGVGDLTLNASNSFAAGSVFLVSGGGVNLGNAAALNGAMLKYNGGNGLNNTSGGAMTPTGITGLQMTAGFTFDGSADLDLSAVEAGFTQTANSTRTITVTAKTLKLAGIGGSGNFAIAPATAKLNGALAKAGAGTLVISSASDYTLGTTISAGTLLVNGTLGSGAVALNGGTLGGGGSISGAVTAA